MHRRLQVLIGLTIRQRKTVTRHRTRRKLMTRLKITPI
ncbi:unnamed protein product [Gongylonema pulchrum]|uniref:Uncharacterized protein n=1 Tax=Gongylonema pulchrum TaxID=637853 RepID=A0A3P7P404_9BILA|nr:unnamed protein product [Gongylonema pulchrum]